VERMARNGAPPAAFVAQDFSPASTAGLAGLKTYATTAMINAGCVWKRSSNSGTLRRYPMGAAGAGVAPRVLPLASVAWRIRPIGRPFLTGSTTIVTWSPALNESFR
jgi:hypothetical protein